MEIALAVFFFSPSDLQFWIFWDFIIIIILILEINILIE